MSRPPERLAHPFLDLFTFPLYLVQAFSSPSKWGMGGDDNRSVARSYRYDGLLGT